MISMKKIEVKVRPPYIKLGDLLKFSGAAETGGDAKNMIADGICFVNDEVCTQRGKKITDKDTVKIVFEDEELIITVTF